MNKPKSKIDKGEKVLKELKKELTNRLETKEPQGYISTLMKDTSPLGKVTAQRFKDTQKAFDKKAKELELKYKANPTDENYKKWYNLEHPADISPQISNAHFDMSDRNAYEAFGLNPDNASRCPFQYYYVNRLRIECPFCKTNERPQFGSNNIMDKREPYCLQCPMMLNVVGNSRRIQEDYADIQTVQTKRKKYTEKKNK